MLKKLGNNTQIILKRVSWVLWNAHTVAEIIKVIYIYIASTSRQCLQSFLNWMQRTVQPKQEEFASKIFYFDTTKQHYVIFWTKYGFYFAKNSGRSDLTGRIKIKHGLLRSSAMEYWRSKEIQGVHNCKDWTMHSLGNQFRTKSCGVVKAVFLLALFPFLFLNTCAFLWALYPDGKAFWFYWAGETLFSNWILTFLTLLLLQNHISMVQILSRDKGKMSVAVKGKIKRAVLNIPLLHSVTQPRTRDWSHSSPVDACIKLKWKRKHWIK